MMCMWAYLCDAEPRGHHQGIVQKIMEERYGVKATAPTGETDYGTNSVQINHARVFVLAKRNEVKQAQLKWNTSLTIGMRVVQCQARLPCPLLVLYTFGSPSSNTMASLAFRRRGKHKTRGGVVEAYSMQSI